MTLLALLLACRSSDPPVEDVSGVDIDDTGLDDTSDDPSASTAVTGDTATPTTSEPPVNVLLVVADDLGVDQLASYGLPVASVPRTPTLDALAAGGLQFDRAYALPRSAPARATLLTGRTPSRHGIGTGVVATDPLGLPDREWTLPERLVRAEAGIATAAIGKWHLGTHTHGGARSPLDHGFGHHAGSLASLLDDWSLDGAPQDYFDWEKATDGVVARTSTYATTAATDDALTALGALPEPWFLYVAYNAPHVPLHWPPSHLFDPQGLGGADPDRRRFHAMVEAMDAELGRLLDGIDPDVLERTVVVFLGDNGTPGHAIPAPLPVDRGKNTLFEGGVHVPLLVSGPGVVPGRSDALVELTDVLPTLTERWGLSPEAVDRPDDATDDLEGSSFLPVWSDPGAPGPRSFVRAEWFEPNHAPTAHDRMVHDGVFKLIVRTSAGGDETHELYDLRPGPVEADDLLQDPLTAEAEAAYALLLEAL